jgi:hypothetical protein
MAPWAKQHIFAPLQEKHIAESEKRCQYISTLLSHKNSVPFTSRQEKIFQPFFGPPARRPWWLPILSYAIDNDKLV